MSIEKKEFKKKVKKGCTPYQVSVDGETVQVFYKSPWLSPKDIVAHIEFYSELISETGYRSHFAFLDEFKEIGIEAYIQALAVELHEELVRKRNPKAAQKKQGTLPLAV